MYVLTSPGLECLYLAVEKRGRSELALVYCCPWDEFISAVMLTAPKLLLLRNFNIHVGARLSGVALEFMDIHGPIPICFWPHSKSSHLEWSK